MSLSVYIDPKQIEKIMAIPIHASKKAFFYMVTEVWGGLREEPPIDHGKLRGEWHLSKRGAFDYKLASGTEYAPHVAFGTGIYGPKRKPIVIRPKVKKCLSFMWKGMRIAVKKVTIKGQKPNPFHERAMKRGEDRIEEFIRTALREYDII